MTVESIYYTALCRGKADWVYHPSYVHTLWTSATLACRSLSVQASDLRDQLPSIPALEQDAPRLRDILELGLHQRLPILDIELSRLESAAERSDTLGVSREVVDDDEAL